MHAGNDLPELPGRIPVQLPCKCCSGEARYFGAVDFNRSCESLTREPLPPAGIAVGYHRCVACGFIFTAAFDHFSHADFARYIYNAQYVLVDPEYETIRPERVARQFASVFPDARAARILDYGAGNGHFASMLRSLGYENVTAYDPFVEQFAQRPSGTFDCITCNEVVEHVPSPRAVFNDLASFMADEAMVLFSTVYQPPELAQRGIDWWYIAPRNGHVSIYTPAAVAAAVRPRPLRLGSFDNVMHVLINKVPAFARRAISG